MVATPWAILLCKFNDDTSAPIYPIQRFDEIFTSAGNGKFNMPNYFRDMSHGKLDLSGSKVLRGPQKGWYTLAHPSSDYLGFDTPIDGRIELVNWAREAAVANGDNLAGFFNVVVVMNTPTDMYGCPEGVAADDRRNRDNGMSNLSPSLLGQEMAHGYGLNHARIEGSTADYMDPFDIMSTGGARMAPHPVYTERDVRGNSTFLIGPGLNAATMNAFGWLDATRVWTGGSGGSGVSTVHLRPLHRTDLPGFLCARVGQYFIEFRMNTNWDAGLIEPLVLIHDYFDGHSYLQRADDGLGFLTAGDAYSEGDVSAEPLPLHGAGLRILVASIDAATQTATINIQRWQDTRPNVGPGISFGGVSNDGGGLIFLNGTWTRVPPRSPLYSILEQMAEVERSQGLTHSRARGLVQQQAYGAIAQMAQAQAARAVSLREPTQNIIGQTVAKTFRRSSE